MNRTWQWATALRPPSLIGPKRSGLTFTEGQWVLLTFIYCQFVEELILVYIVFSMVGHYKRNNFFSEHLTHAKNDYYQRLFCEVPLMCGEPTLFSFVFGDASLF